jgi:TPR repeat protein
MPIRLALFCVFSIACSTIALAQEAPLTDCDKYGASDLDAQRKATGISFYRLDPALAIPACEDAVRQYPTSARFLFQLGRAYLKANNFAAALEKFRKAADQNHALAQFDVGFMYESGRGVRRNDQEAVIWLRRAAEQGLATAQQNLAMMYQDGRGVQRDDQQAVVWLRKAADQNDVMAQFNLGVAYANGRGIQKDDQQAAIWFRKAADQGLDTAQISIGLMYARGQGVPKDERQAVFWYRKAANQGNKRAQVMLEELQTSKDVNKGR